MPDLIQSVAELREWRKSLPANRTVGLIPTMGALHEGHLSLVRKSIANNSHTVVSIFVNPLQFGAGEDFEKYPRTLNQDFALLNDFEVDVVFAPDRGEIIRPDSTTIVEESLVSQPLCGPFRPGHFKGVATIVLKLLNLVQPTSAYFGQKDAQQCAVVERIVRDLNVPVNIIRGETKRESDGLALSSRNLYLSAEDRDRAKLIYQSMMAAERAYAHGEKNANKLISLGRWILEADPTFNIQYWTITDPYSLQPLTEVGDDGALIAIAAYLGKTRLIDNLRLLPPGMRDASGSFRRSPV